jgi:hypothetical protein
LNSQDLKKCFFEFKTFVEKHTVTEKPLYPIYNKRKYQLIKKPEELPEGVYLSN